MSGDLISELINRMLAAHQEGRLTRENALRIEQEFRREFNGAECYIKERTEVTVVKKQEAVVSAYLAGEPVDRITKENGISRATLYRYLKR
ncbi:helix-turn-helix domain-containing protein [Dechloromonas sp. CZR5]|uniref:helix-turn-helix domain-containing protein n=1 Tax=Dechloromonas sp. CZR5 TaxID=2608630 RepID=UPI00123D9808|nr:helix-turn-helix domain-containing protein [Dechloromonas sp. CZR5]